MLMHFGVDSVRTPADIHRDGMIRTEMVMPIVSVENVNRAVGKSTPTSEEMWMTTTMNISRLVP